MLDIKIENKIATTSAEGSHKDLVKEAISLEAHLHRFVYHLGPLDYIAFLTLIHEIMDDDSFINFLESEADQETRITLPILNREDEKDGE